MNMFQEVRGAEKRIREHIRYTPLEFSPYLSEMCGCNVYLKLESEQLTGSFKIRGAFNKILSHQDLDDLVTASTGNHGKAVAYVLNKFGLNGTVYVPENASPAKLEVMMRYGIQVKKHKGTSGETEVFAREQARESGQVFISPYNDNEIIAGQGTVAYEIMEKLPDVDAIFCPIGGGGLISGIGGYVKHGKKDLVLVGCEPEASCAMSASIKAGDVVDVKHKPTLSDGSAGGVEPGSVTFDYCKQLVDSYTQVSEEEIKNAMLLVLSNHQKIVEGAAAVPIASLIKRKEEFKDKNVVVVVSGAGISVEMIRKILCA